MTGAQLDAVYEKLLGLVNGAGRAPWSVDPDEKKLSRADVIAFIKDQATHAGMPPMTAGTKLKRKMTAAKMPASDIEAALDLRRRQRLRALDNGYLDPAERDKIATSVLTLLSGLRADLLANPSESDGAPFLARCRNELKALATKNGSVDHVLEGYLVGYMYEVTDRCQHTFTRA